MGQFLSTLALALLVHLNYRLRQIAKWLSGYSPETFDFPQILPDPRVRILDIKGNQFIQGESLYRIANYQYASSTHRINHDMNPGLIVQPQSKDDIKRVIKYAKANKIAIAVRTGGHQYSGASSTGSKNILLDLKTTFQGPTDRIITFDTHQPLVRTSVSWDLGSFNAYLASNKVFVPHGQCESVHIGGHVQSGGYGQLGRSFGLLGDHVVSLEIIDHNGEEREITKQNDPEQFYAWLGGSPGNLGVLTHFTIKVHRDQDHQNPIGLQAIYFYEPATLERLLNSLADMANDANFPRNYDFCISVLSSSFPLLDIWPNLDSDMQREHPRVFGTDHLPAWPATIVVYAQYCPMHKDDTPDMGWFDSISKDCAIKRLMKDKPMSALTGEWIFRNVREYNKPYVKRTYGTNSTTLRKDGWAKWLSRRLNDIIEPTGNGCWISAQIQCFGGQNSKFYQNRDNGTAYSWRDSTVIATVDCFHNRDQQDRAEDWQAVNDAQGLGPKGIFSKQEKRFLWGSYGSFDLNSVWQTYYENETKYKRLQKARKAADPDGVFTPNTFCVPRAT